MLDLNNFQYDKKREWYASKLEINGILVEMYVDNEEVKDIKILNDRLNLGMNWVKNNYEMIRDYCADNLLELKNDYWLEDEREAKLTKEQFKDRLELESISIESDGELNIGFKGGGLFCDHWIVVDTDSEYNLLEAYIEG